MWGFKDPKERIEILTPSQACTTCGCVIAYGRGKQVIDDRDWGTRELLGLSYCDGCSPPYDKVRVDSLTGQAFFYKKIPAHTLEVTEKGKAIKKAGG